MRPFRLHTALCAMVLVAPALVAPALVAPALVRAQQPAPQATPLPGYTPAAAARQRALEARAIAVPDSATAERHARALSAESHVAGTEAQARTRDYVVGALRRLGIPTEVRAYRVWLPHATGVSVTRVAANGDTLALDLREPAVSGDAASALAQYPTVNGTSGAGAAEGELVYVNYGLVEDYAALDSLGVSVRGKVAVARYGRSFRGIKAREAERHGAVALLVYSDPADDGYARGDVYPEGPMRPAAGVQRGSVYNGTGDPSTPGWPSTASARRLPEDSMAVPRIPVVPIAYGNARLLLEQVRGTAIPTGWQGALPFRYHVGPGPVRARVRVTDDRATNGYKTIWNTFGIVRGAERPDELVLVGAHRDGWGPGATDNVSGTVSVLEAARAVAAELKAGRRPRRTLVFATWDAEEWGLVGSTEYVEDDSLRLQRGAVAYLNQDVSASGPSFGGGGSPSLRATLRDVARTIADPSGAGSVYDVWRRAAPVAAGEEPAMGDPGGGSDFAGFYNHLGIPIADWGFGGPGGVYHSQYDSHEFVRRFADPGFRYHAAAARVGTAMLLRLANADVVPFDYVEYARTLRGKVTGLERQVQARTTRRDATDAGSWQAVRPAALVEALDALERSAVRFAAVRDSALAAPRPPDAARLDAANAALRDVERAITRPTGLVGRPWFRNLVYAADVDNGYATILFPGVAEAIRAGDAARAQAEIDELVTRIGAARAAVERAGAVLAGARPGAR